MNSPASALSAEDAGRLLQQGLALHREGRFAEALQVYATLLAHVPGHADALHLTGEALYRQGRPKLALNYVNGAIARSPHHFYFNTRATIFMQLGLPAEAQQDLRRAIKAQPGYAEAHVNLSAVYRQQKKFRQASEAAAEATRLAPQVPAAWNNAGAIDMEQDRFDEAIAQFQRALALDPNYAAAHKNIGKIRAHQKDWPAAVDAMARAAADPRDLEASFLLSKALQGSGRVEEAIAPMQHAMRNWPAEERHKALADPDGVAALYGICGALEGVSMRFAESAELYRLALESLPEHELLLNNLGTANFRLGQYGSAIEALKKALQAHPRQVLARCNLGVTYVMSGRSEAAIAEFEQCLRDDPQFMPAMVWLLGEKAHIADWQGVPALRASIASLLDRPDNDQTVSSFILMSHYDDARRLMEWTRRGAALADAGTGIQPFADRSARRNSPRIRVGYYSFDFRNHPVAHLTAELFSRHDRKDFEVFVYSYGPDDGHPARARIAAAAEHFVDMHGQSIRQMAQRIREDELDILVDLSGDTRGAKPQVMAYHAAPAQLMWLGYMGTSGTPNYDYLVSDNFLSPPGTEGAYTEKLLRMPETFQVIDTQRPVNPHKATRAAHGLPEDAFVLCNFSQSFKIQPETFDAWVRIVREIPNAVLWLAQGPEGFERNLRNQWEAAGLGSERLIVSPRMPVDQHLARIGLADLFIDTFPYSSGATANDVLWSGVPLLALTGTTMVSRMAGSLMGAIGLPELVAANHDEYVQKAVHCATHPQELAALRARLAAARDARRGYFDTPRFVRHLEDGFRQIAARSRQGLPAAHVDVAARPQDK
ncbi:tetratricopeptide repeat protein [Variovorax paradoxus]|uniref:protein O-GlcNAc transferase n=1 Tax=Variovorax paradoxus TaxID=34073 RepID=A0A679J6V3_VARPD|nr:Beta-barrel assembly-enhancing protease [Variovorax paradoxus]